MEFSVGQRVRIHPEAPKGSEAHNLLLMAMDKQGISKSEALKIVGTIQHNDGGDTTKYYQLDIKPFSGSEEGWTWSTEKQYLIPDKDIIINRVIWNESLKLETK